MILRLANTNPIEVLWLLGCSYTLILCIRRYRKTRASRRAADTPSSIAIATSNVCIARNRSYRVAFYVAIAARSLTQPPPVEAGNQIISALIALGFISLAITEQRDVRRESRTQTRLLADEDARRKAEQERSTAAARDPKTYGLRKSDRERSS